MDTDHKTKQDEYEEMLDKCGARLCHAFSLRKSNYERMDGFIMYNSRKDSRVERSYTTRLPNLLQTSLVEYRSFIRTSRTNSSSTNLYLFGLMELRHSYPTTYIYRETIREKIVDWFVKGDIDFPEHKLFSDRFHTVTKDKERLMLILGSKPLDLLAAFPHLELELDGNKCLFRVSQDEVSPEETDKFIELVNVLKNVL